MHEEDQKILTPLRAIRAKCVDCSAGSMKEVRECVMLDCPCTHTASASPPTASLAS